MFERRLKIFLAILFAATLLLVGRAAQVQIARRHEWSEQAADAMKRVQLIDTTRGTLRDCKGSVIAIDVACIDACVDYRALTDPPDDEWLTNLAINRIHARRAAEWRSADAAGKKQILLEEKKSLTDRIASMWIDLAEMTGEPIEEIDDLRHDIVRRIEMARRYTWYRKYKLASDKHEKQNENRPSNHWLDWLSGEGADDAPRLEDFDEKVAAQTQAHPIVHAISSEVQIKLGKNLDDYPGLVLKPGMTRSYPYKDIACHVIGSLSRVRQDDIRHDVNAGDELKKYQYTDLIGRTGLESLCEPLLRGERGRIERYLGDDSNAITQAPTSGKDISTTIDMDLQEQVLQLFQKAHVELASANPLEPKESRTISVHGGAVLIELKTGAVRALVSNPTFDPNTLAADLATLMKDNLNRPLLNRATQYPLEPGSTIKPVIGIGAITQGVLGLNEGIECTGFLMIHGHRQPFGRCWVATKFTSKLGENGVMHHPIPYEAPHRGHDGNQDGWLTFSDALERSCNIFFETVGHRLGIQGMSYWMDQFGLGRPTGIGIGELRGTLPDSDHNSNPEYISYICGIGQSPVSATAIQMANVAATIARNGEWMRPTLLNSGDTDSLRSILRAGESSARSTASPASQPANDDAWWKMPDQVKLNISPDAVAAAHDGMFRVVNGAAGTGTILAQHDPKKASVVIAAKTGTAQAAEFRLPAVDSDGKIVRDSNGHARMLPVEATTVDHESSIAPWYINFDQAGKNYKHSWIIGFAPAKNPQVAFAVMVEYGGSGGQTAAQIAKGMLDAAIEQRYLSPDTTVITTEAR